MAQGLQDIPIRIPEQWDPAWYARHLREVLAFADTRNSIEGAGIVITGQSDGPATIATSTDIQNLLMQTFVLATPSGFLQHERTLDGESGVVQIIDHGANSTIEVALEEGGIALSKLHDLSNWGVLGNPVDGSGGVQNIQPSADGEVLATQGTALGFTLTPVWKGSHTWNDDFAVVLGTGGDLTIKHNGTDTSMVNTTGAFTLSNVGSALRVTALSYKVTTNSVDRFEIDSSGAWLIAGSAGTSGYVPTSAGAGAPVVWAPQTGSGSGSLTFVTEVSVSGAAATNITIGSLNIDTDECYFVQVAIAGAAAGAATLNIFFNGDTTATNYERSLNGTAGDNAVIGGLDNGAPGLWNGYLRRCPVTGRIIWSAQGGRIITTTNIDYSSNVIWDTSANLTSFTINSSVASQIAIGSMIRVWKLSS